MRIKPKKIFITGASSDIGMSVLKKFNNKNYNIIAHYNKGNRAFFSYLKLNRKIKKIQFDFHSSNKKVENFFKQKSFMDIDIYVNAAAYLNFIKYENVNLDDIYKTLKVNLFPGIISTKIFGQNMSKRKWGRIVHLSSIGSKFGGGEGSFCYSLSKHGLEFFPSKTKEWIKKNVLINTIRVGATNTKIHKKLPGKNLSDRAKLIPMGRLAEVNEISNYIYFIASEQNTYIANQTLTIAGGE